MSPSDNVICTGNAIEQTSNSIFLEPGQLVRSQRYFVLFLVIWICVVPRLVAWRLTGQGNVELMQRTFTENA